MDNRKKTYVEVIVKHTPEGGKIPLNIAFEDGRHFEIDKVQNIRRAAATKVGGSGMRYTIVVGTSQTYLFEDEDQWFVEEKVGSR